MAPALVSLVPSALARPLAQGAMAVLGVGGRVAWSAAVAVARAAVLGVFAGVEVGQLVVVDEDGTRHVFGAEAEEESSELVVRDGAFWVRTLVLSDVGLADAYMLGEVECAELTAFFRLFVANRARLGDGQTRVAGLVGRVAWALQPGNTRARSLLNAAAHYDLGNDMFAAFLSPDMTYSCALWASADDSLETAQLRKLDAVVDRARIKAHDRVLEIGTGWGSFAVRAVQRTGCTVTTITLSRAQHALAVQRVRAAGLDDRITVLLMDYRAFAASTYGQTPFDKIVSIEMLEAVGAAFLGGFFACVDRLLKRDGGIAVFQCITMPEGRLAAYARRVDFIRRYIFPGGYLPSTTQLLTHIAQQSAGTLIVERVDNIGGHYARTLRLWREAFQDRFDSHIGPALRRTHPSMTDAAVAVFRRKWVYYFCYCEAGFVTKTLGDVIVVVAREGAQELMEGIPL